MYRPHTRVVKWPCHDNVTIRWHADCVTAQWVLQIETDGCLIPFGDTTLEHDEVVTVEVDRMSDTM